MTSAGTSTTLRDILSLIGFEKKVKLWLLISTRLLLQFLDLFGLVAIGLLVATVNGSSPPALLRKASSELMLWMGMNPAVAAICVASLFVFKSSGSALLMRATLLFLSRIEASASSQILKTTLNFGDISGRKSSKGGLQWSYVGSSHRAFQWMIYSATNVLTEGFLALVIIIGIFVVDPLTALGMGVFFGLLSMAYQKLIGPRLKSLGSNVAASVHEINDQILDIWGVAREATARGRLIDLASEINSHRSGLARDLALQKFWVAFPRYFFEIATLLGLVLITLVSQLRGSETDATMTLSIFLVGAFRLLSALLPLQTAVSDVRTLAPQCGQALTDLEKFRLGISGRRREESTSGSPDPQKVLQGNISSRGALVLGDRTLAPLYRADLEIPANTVTAIIGKSGAGKTSLLETLCGLRQVAEGTIEIGGESAYRLLRARPGFIGYVPQSPTLLRGSIVRNITLNPEGSSFDQILLETVIQESEIEEMVAQRGGIHSAVANDGDKLSGGQTQRVAIARALYGRPRILFLDEPTSGLDGESESQVLGALKRLSADMTIVFTTHKKSAAAISDSVVVVEHSSCTWFSSLAETVQMHPDLLT